MASEMLWTRLPARACSMPTASASCVLSRSRVDGRRDRADGNGRGGVADPAVEDDADVELDDVGVLDAARAADAVDDLVVDGDADVAGEAAIVEEGAASAPVVDQARGELVDFAGGNARHDGEGNFLEDFAGRAATDAHALDFVRRLDGDAHGTTKGLKVKGKRKRAMKSAVL